MEERLKRGEVVDVVLNNLYEHTALQTVFGVNVVALVNKQPRQLDLKTLLDAFLRHRREVGRDTGVDPAHRGRGASRRSLSFRAWTAATLVRTVTLTMS